MEALKLRNWPMGPATVRNAQAQAGLNQAGQAQVQAEARTKGESATLGLPASLQQAACARLVSFWKALDEKRKTPYRKPASNPPPPEAVTIPPLTAQQYTRLKTWNMAAQVGTYSFAGSVGAGIGAGIGLVFWQQMHVSLAGAFAGVMLGAYEALGMASVQDEFEEAYQQGSSVKVWREGRTLKVDGNTEDGFCTQINSPLAIVYMTVITWILSGRLP